MSESVIVERRLEAIRSAQTASAWIDRAGWSWIEMTGADRVDLLHRLTTNDLTRLVPGSGIQTVLLTEKARILDVLTVLQDEDRCYLLGSPETSAQTIQWLRKYVIMDDVKLQNRTSTVHAIEICGPRAADTVIQLTGLDVSVWATGQWQHCRIESGNVIVVRIPSISEVSYWLVADPEAASALLGILHENADTIPQLTNEEAEYLRVLAGMGKHGHEWTDAYNPLEAGLLHLTSFTKGCYIGQEVVARLDSYNKVKQRVMGLVSQATLVQGDRVVSEGLPIGSVTSVVPSLEGSHTLALAYVRGEHAHPNTRLTIVTDSGDVTAEQVLPPLQDPSCQ
ncbi:MAG: hypothetical protein IPH49_02945 [Ignavibacteria bacterium]|nr:hypothetical protein [Ignavibacteria bacterium]